MVLARPLPSENTLSRFGNRRSAKDSRMRPASRARPPAPPDNRPANAIRSPANADSRLEKPVDGLANAAGSPTDAVGRLGNPVCRLGNAVSGLGNAVCKSAKPLRTAHVPKIRPFWPFLALPRPPNRKPAKTALARHSQNG